MQTRRMKRGRLASQRSRERRRDQLRQDVADNIWDGETRFDWTKETRSHMYSGGNVDQASGITVYLCATTRKWYPRKQDLATYKRAHPEIKPEDFDYISIDHIQDYRNYIMNNSKDGRPTRDEAKVLYSDVNNLMLLCQKRNSQKGNR